MSDSSYYDGASDTEGWDDQFAYVDDDGLQYTEQDAQELVASRDYEFVDERLTPDTPLDEFNGSSLRQVWDTLPPNERSAAREAYAVERYKQLREQNG